MAGTAHFALRGVILGIVLAFLGRALADGVPAAALPPTGGGPPAARAPLPPEGFLESCLSLMQRQRYREARDRLLPVVGDHPGWGRAHFYLALTFHKEDRYAEALPLFDRAIELEPEYQPPRFYRAWCHYYLGDLAAARVGFESYLGLNPNYPDAIFALGLIDFDADDVGSARRRFERTIELALAKQDRATEAKARARLADVWVRLNDVAAARQELDRSLALNPENHEAWFKLSRVLERLGDGPGAEGARLKHAEAFARAHPGPPPRPTAPEAP